MKKYNLQKAILVSIFLLFIACDKEKDGLDNTPPKSVLDIKITPGYGSLHFSWTPSEDEDLLYVDIQFTNSKGVQRSVKTSSYANETTIYGFSDTKEYKFMFTAYDKDGNASETREIEGTPDTPPFLLVIDEIQVQPAFGGIKLKWTNVTESDLKVLVNYTPEGEKEQSASFKAEAEKNGEWLIDNLKAVPTKLKIIVVDAEGNQSDVKELEITPSETTKISKENWTVVDFSSEEIYYEEGYIDYVFDDDLDTYWQTAYSISTPDYPHYFTIDMGQKVAINSFECYRLEGDDYVHTKIQFFVSEDGNNWSDMGEFPFALTDDAQNFILDTAPTARYFKFVALEGPEFYTALAEITIHGSVITE
jgi:hypothetical protein